MLGACFAVAKCHKRPRLITSFYGTHKHHNKYSSFTDSGCNHGDIRLQDGNETFGRVEICNNNTWGTICQDRWWQRSNNAKVICRQLGHSPDGAVTVNRGFVMGNYYDAIWLDDVQCQGNETKLINCPANKLGVHNNNCQHLQDVGVSCIPIGKQ